MKRPLFILLTLLQFSVIADSNLKELIKDEQGKCLAVATKRKFKGRRGYFGSNYSKIYILQKSSLEETYCKRMFPKNYKLAFLSNYDLPASLLDINVTSDLNSFKNSKALVSTDIYHKSLDSEDMNILANLQISRTDLENFKNQFENEEILYLNVKAMNIWKQLINNYGHEKAKEFYYSKKLSKQEIKEILFFKKEVISLLKSTSIQNTWGLNIYNKLHPLLTQTIIEGLAFHFPMKSGIYDRDKDFTARLDYISFKQKDLNYFSINSSDREDLEKKIFQEGSDYEESSYNYRSKFLKLDSLPPGSFRSEQLFINSLNLLQMNSNIQCEQWGLTPGISRVILDYINLTAQSYNSYKHQFIQNNILHRLKMACGGNKFELEHKSFPRSIWLNEDSPLFGRPSIVTYLTTSPIYRTQTSESKKLYKYFKKLTNHWYK